VLPPPLIPGVRHSTWRRARLRGKGTNVETEHYNESNNDIKHRDLTPKYDHVDALFCAALLTKWHDSYTMGAIMDARKVTAWG
jgi:hypothetical protein